MILAATGLNTQREGRRRISAKWLVQPGASHKPSGSCDFLQLLRQRDEFMSLLFSHSVVDCIDIQTDQGFSAALPPVPARILTARQMFAHVTERTSRIPRYFSLYGKRHGFRLVRLRAQDRWEGTSVQRAQGNTTQSVGSSGGALCGSTRPSDREDHVNTFFSFPVRCTHSSNPGWGEAFEADEPRHRTDSVLD